MSDVRADGGRNQSAIIGVCETLKQRFGVRATSSADVRRQHATNSYAHGAEEPPDLVVFPGSETEIVEIVKLCHERRVPIIPFGTWTSFEGQTNAPFGGVCVDTSRIQRPSTRAISTASWSRA